MSDDQYDYYQYEEQQQEESAEENVEMTLEFENCQAEQYLRENKFAEALKAFTDIYNKANQHNIKTWKAKALHQLLDMHIKMKNGAEAKKTLHIIREMNQVDKTNEQSVKSIIKTLNSVEKDVYYSFWEDIYGLIRSIEEPISQLKCYFLMLQKQIESKNAEKSTEIYEKIVHLSNTIEKLPLASELQMKYLQILYLKLQKLQFSSKLRSLYIKLPNYEQDSNSNEAYISSIKQFIAPALYEEQNYVECASFLCGSFIENSRYGSNFQKNKQLLKLNCIMVLLCGDLKFLEDKQFNSILHESTAGYKIEPDIQAIYGLFQAFKSLDIDQFQEILKSIKLNLPATSPYAHIEKKILSQIKKQKIATICKSYKTIKFDYIKRRINESDDKNIKQYLFSLIASGKLNGVIHLQDRYLEIVDEDNTFYTVQIENLKDLTERMN